MTRSRSSRRRPWFAIGLVVALSIVAANMAAYVIYRLKTIDDVQPEDLQFTTSSLLETSSVTVNKLTSIKVLAREQREEAIASFRDGDYDQAIRYLEAATKLDPNVADGEILIEVLKRLKTATRNQTQNLRSQKRSIARRGAVKHSSSELLSTLLITTIPKGILVELDAQPVGLTPARVTTTAGRHQLKLRRGPEVLLERKIVLRPGQKLSIEKNFSTPVPSKEPEPNSVNTTRRELPPQFVASSRLTPSSTSTMSPDDGVKRPALLIYWPDKPYRELQRFLGSDLSGIEVTVTQELNTFKQGLRQHPDAVMADPRVLLHQGLPPQLIATQSSADDYLIASFHQPIALDTLPSITIGIVNELGRRRTSVLAYRIIGHRTTTFRQVKKSEDLLSLLQFSIAQAVIVRKTEFDWLQNRTRQKLHTTALPPQEAKLGVALLETEQSPRVALALESMQEKAKRALGVQFWQR